MSRKDANKWCKGMEEEMNSLYKNKTWTLVSRPNGQKVIGNKWIYKMKEGVLDVELARYKSRVIAKGFT